MMRIHQAACGVGGDRQVAIQVRGTNGQSRQRHALTTIVVPYSRLSQTIQIIHRAGGQITGISLHSGPLGRKTGETAPESQQILPTPSRQAPPETRKVVFQEPAPPPPPVPEIDIPASQPRTEEKSAASPAPPAVAAAIAPARRGRGKRSPVRRRRRGKKPRAKGKVYLLGLLCILFLMVVVGSRSEI